MYSLTVTKIDSDAQVVNYGSNEQMLWDYLLAAVGRSGHEIVHVGEIRRSGVIWDADQPDQPRFRFRIELSN